MSRLWLIDFLKKSAMDIDGLWVLSNPSLDDINAVGGMRALFAVVADASLEGSELQGNAVAVIRKLFRCPVADQIIATETDLDKTLLLGLNSNQQIVVVLVLEHLAQFLLHPSQSVFLHDKTILDATLACLSSGSATIAEAAHGALLSLARDPQFSKTMLEPALFSRVKELQTSSVDSSVLFLRVKALVVEIACVSEAYFQSFEAYGHLADLSRRLASDDVLLQANILELIHQIAARPFGVKPVIETMGVLNLSPSYSWTNLQVIKVSQVLWRTIRSHQMFEYFLENSSRALGFLSRYAEIKDESDVLAETILSIAEFASFPLGLNALYLNARKLALLLPELIVSDSDPLREGSLHGMALMFAELSLLDMQVISFGMALNCCRSLPLMSESNEILQNLVSEIGRFSLERFGDRNARPGMLMTMNVLSEYSKHGRDGKSFFLQKRALRT
jgi:hypothetical protein